MIHSRLLPRLTNASRRQGDYGLFWLVTIKFDSVLLIFSRVKPQLTNSRVWKTIVTGGKNTSELCHYFWIIAINLHWIKCSVSNSFELRRHLHDELSLSD